MIGFVIALYLTLGGFNSVLTTDVIQAAGILILLAFLLILYNPPGSSLANIIEVSQKIIPPVDFIVLFILGFFAIIGAADVYQRIYAARSDKETKKGLLIAGIAIIVFGVLMILLGLKIFTQFPLADPNNAFFDFLTSGLSTTIITLLSIFLVASIFSTADTELFLSSILINKLINRKKLNSSTSKLLIWIIIILATIFSIYSTSLVDIYFALLYTFMIIGPVMLARLWGRGNDNVAFWTMLSSTIILIVLGIFNKIEGLYPLIPLIPLSLNFIPRAKP